MELQLVSAMLLENVLTTGTLTAGLVEVTNCMDCMFSGFFPLGISQTTWNY
jgi:hypothetical protein